ncbi:hydantoinase/oxoprolinase N-terminal domain-containing protein [Sulfitobacter sp.]|uniref:hydantoinase/oxoprolinase N-terminal domain-containing protein n=1 Tax=Sulfitobacter sp. TaxID=1903071 RepID=UPI003FCCD9DC
MNVLVFFGRGNVARILHGTTIATNSVLMRDLPCGALIATKGFEDMLKTGRHTRRDIYALRGPDRTLRVPCRHRFGAQSASTFLSSSQLRQAPAPRLRLLHSIAVLWAVNLLRSSAADTLPSPTSDPDVCGAEKRSFCCK